MHCVAEFLKEFFRGEFLKLATNRARMINCVCSFKYEAKSHTLTEHEVVIYRTIGELVELRLVANIGHIRLNFSY